MGKMVIIMDDEDRENEGDLIMAASMVRPEDINFMARYGRGLICLTLTRERCRQLSSATDGQRQPGPAFDQLYSVDRGGRRRYHGHFRLRPRTHGADCRAARTPGRRTWCSRATFFR